MILRRELKIILSVFIALYVGTAHAADVPQSFTLDGRLFSNPEGTTPLADASVGIRLQILDEDKLCILYEESQTVSTLASQGYFSIQVGSVTTSTKRTASDSGKTMTEVFTNLNAITGKSVANGSPCNIAATGGKRRFVRMIVTPMSLGGAPRTLSPDLSIDSVPNAVIAERAESLQGYRSTDMLKVNTAAGSALTQSNLESLFTSTTRFNALSSVVDGTSPNYMRSNSAGGAQLPVLSGAPMTPAAGSIWFDSSDEKLKYQASGGPVTLTTGGAGISSLTGDVTASGTGAVAATVASVGGSTAANVNAATVLANAATDANTNSAIVRRDVAGGFSASAVTATKVTVAGPVVSTPGVIATGGTVDLRTSNTYILNDVQGSTITLTNPAHGGLYNIVAADPAARTYTFAGCTNAYFKPAKGPTTLNTQTVYGVLLVAAGGGTYNCYITWSTGFLP